MSIQKWVRRNLKGCCRTITIWAIICCILRSNYVSAPSLVCSLFPTTSPRPPLLQLINLKNTTLSALPCLTAHTWPTSSCQGFVNYFRVAKESNFGTAVQCFWYWSLDFVSFLDHWWFRKPVKSREFEKETCTSLAPVAGRISGPLSHAQSRDFFSKIAWSPDFTSFLIQVISWAKICSAQEDSTRWIQGFHFEEFRFYLVLFGKENVKTFSKNVLIRVKCSFFIENLFRRDYLD